MLSRPALLLLAAGLGGVQSVHAEDLAAAAKNAGIAGVVAAGATSVKAIPAVLWRALNATVSGRLGVSLPLELSCFNALEGSLLGRNAEQCQGVIDGYTSPSYRVQFPAGYMYPQWETCQTSGETCVLDGTAPSNPLAWTTANCSQGSIPPFYVRALHFTLARFCS